MTWPGALQVLDALVAAAVEDSARDDPPASPAPGDCYLIGGNPTGEWSQHAGHLAAFGTAGWRFVAPLPGMAVFVKATETVATYGASGWDVGTVRGSRIVIDGQQVIGPQAAPIADPAGGTTIDSEARSTLEQILATLRHHGLIGNE